MEPLKPTQIRAIDVLRARKEGWTFAKIAEEFGISKDHARQLSIKGQRLVHELWSNDPQYELSVRTRNALTAVGVVPTPDGVRRHFRSAEDLKRVPNIGNKGIDELQDWSWKEANTLMVA